MGSGRQGMGADRVEYARFFCGFCEGFYMGADKVEYCIPC